MTILSRFSTLGGKIGDQYYSNVSLLLNGDNLLDYSSSSKIVTNIGSVSVDTTNKKYGIGSLSFNGTNQYLHIPDEGYTSSTDLTWECWFRKTGNMTLSTGLIMLPFSPSQLTSVSAQIYVQSTGTIRLACRSGAGTALNGPSITINTWYHVAYTRNGSIGRLYLNGVLASSAADHTHASTGDRIFIGSNAGSFLHTGNIDEIRITEGIARYTSNFTPPDQPFPTY